MLLIARRLLLPALMVLCAVAVYGKQEVKSLTNSALTNDFSNQTVLDTGKSRHVVPFSFDVTMGVFFPLFDLGTGMNAAYDLSLGGFVPATFLLPFSFLDAFDLGVSFYMVPGNAVSGRNAGILFLGALVDAYYRLPFGIRSFNVYALLGLGIGSTSAWVANGTVTGSMSSADFILRPGVGCRWEFLPQWYARLDITWFMAFEKVSAIGLPVTLGVGYAF